MKRAYFKQVSHYAWCHVLYRAEQDQSMYPFASWLAHTFALKADDEAQQRREQ
jgi:hypothetical protein